MVEHVTNTAPRSCRCTGAHVHFCKAIKMHEQHPGHLEHSLEPLIADEAPGDGCGREVLGGEHALRAQKVSAEDDGEMQHVDPSRPSWLGPHR